MAKSNKDDTDEFMLKLRKDTIKEDHDETNDDSNMVEVKSERKVVQRRESLLFSGNKKKKMKNVMIQSRVPEDIFKFLKEEAVINETNMSGIICSIIVEFIHKRLEENSKSNDLNM